MAATIVRKIGSNLGKNLREIRIHLCQRSPESQGVRDFIEQNYVELKKANPQFPILIRECSEVQPKLWARYVEKTDQDAFGLKSIKNCTGRVLDFGKEVSVSLHNLKADQVAKALESAANSKP